MIELWTLWGTARDEGLHSARPGREQENNAGGRCVLRTYNYAKPYHPVSCVFGRHCLKTRRRWERERGGWVMEGRKGVDNTGVLAANGTDNYREASKQKG